MKIATNLIDQYLKKIAQEKISGCLLYGPENAVSRFRFDLIAKKIVEDLRDPFLVANLSNERLKSDHGILADEFYSISMMGGRKLITIKDANEDTISALKILFADPQYGRKSSNFILILAGDLAKNSALRKIIEDSQFIMALPSYEENFNNIAENIRDLFAQNNIEITPEALNILFKNYGKDRNLLINEIHKISAYMGYCGQLDSEILSKTSLVNNFENLYDFAILFANKNYQLCLEKAERALEKGNETMLITRGLMNYYNKLYTGKLALEEGKSIEEIIRNSQIFFKNEKDFRQNLQNISLKFIIKILQALEKLEINLKKGILPQRLLVLSFIRSFLVKKRG